ncbi:MAG TPA: hypothetical protein VMI31_18780 [Fimbriimonadaceae bacterium]|nr:hypothetical protein [Fimbriimonadaceae bacterium]
MKHGLSLTFVALMTITLPTLSHAKAWTALGRLPAERIVVYDPVSNSFAFVIDDSCTDATDLKNREILDRHRLALTTQKIRLLIMPYNPIGVTLTFEAKRNTSGGSEFEEMPGAKVSKATDTETAPTNVSPPPQTKKVLSDDTLKNAKKTTAGKATDANSRLLKQLRSLDLATEATVSPEKQPDQRLDILLKLSAKDERFNDDLQKMSTQLVMLQNSSNCFYDNISSIPTKANRILAQGSLSLARDVTLGTIEKEAQRRTEGLTQGKFYEGCLESSGVKSFENDIQGLNAQIGSLKSSLASARQSVDTIKNYISVVKNTEPLKSSNISSESWQEQISLYERRAQDYQRYIDDLSKSEQGIETQVASTRARHDSFVAVLGTPALQLQRKNYDPLADGESITFTFTRSAVDGAAEDGSAATSPRAKKKTTAAAPPGASDQFLEATIELKSAPTRTFRFGTGVVASYLRNPSFTAGPENLGSDGKGNGTKNILYSDRSDGQAQVGIFVHHYWGRRSGLLTPTWFERLVPGFSFGLPITMEDPLQSFLIGLDWELVPGVDLNVGAHWGKVNSLADHYHVNQPIPKDLDVSTIQEKRFRTGFYAGIVLGTDIFQSLTNSQSSKNP